ncbi:MAG: NAD(P)/FAD-dependent oxidoreductase [Chitinophagales bacterium]|nr:NAD(P)/FAD-dependent oxidoreductase [Chitinophagales bacterium]
MPQTFQLQVLPEEAQNEDLLKIKVSQFARISKNEIGHIHIAKRSIDARQKIIKINLIVDVYSSQEKYIPQNFHLPQYPSVAQADPIIIVGAGPAGLFAAVKAIEKGKKPIVIERGKDVRARRIDLRALNIHHQVNEDSNYCFGEGGAGTYSDGKLYTRSTKRGDVVNVLQWLVALGADSKILVDAHPHIGTNKLPQIIINIRNFILESGGEILFNSRVVDFKIQFSKIGGVILKNGDTISSNKVILATGHSARDIYELLQKKNIHIETKPFALGLRVEHSQSLIDQIQYKNPKGRGEYLPPASYSLVKQENGRGVYSFCMCPGGIIAPCATSPGEVVTNGWSPSKRDQATSNSGIVVELKDEDFAPFSKFGPLAAMEYQKMIEQRAWKLAGETQKVPAQRLVDFVNGNLSKDIPKTSYIPGTTSIELSEILPKNIHQALQRGFQQFELSMPGYLNNEAVLHAVESRTSSPVRIPRDKETLEHPQIKGLYPCAEGAGYAGGIVSAAIDGLKCAEKACN